MQPHALFSVAKECEDPLLANGFTLRNLSVKEKSVTGIREILQKRFLKLRPVIVIMIAKIRTPLPPPVPHSRYHRSSRNFNEIKHIGILVLVDEICRLVHPKDADNRAIRIPDRGIPREKRSPL